MSVSGVADVRIVSHHLERLISDIRYKMACAPAWTHQIRWSGHSPTGRSTDERIDWGSQIQIA